ncbi:hypothetical protein [Phascolarctobacterium succinatutens]|uniref:hypothetical protein n=1 Tax=Phascolarctobacterium succinatutens TaxID=626940 RepID=UPI0026F0F7F2|nr:hypothetical protein [Phascolarctobacterium succinatutens]
MSVFACLIKDYSTNFDEKKEAFVKLSFSDASYCDVKEDKNNIYPCCKSKEIAIA